MKQPIVDFVLVIDELRKEGKIKISPISREANSFDCPKARALSLGKRQQHSYDLEMDPFLLLFLFQGTFRIYSQTVTDLHSNLHS